MTPTMQFFIGCAVCLLAVGMGIGIGMALTMFNSRKSYAQVVTRCTAATVARMQEAMGSLGYSTEDVRSVIRRMGVKVMPPHVSRPTSVLTPDNVSDIDYFCGTCPSFKDDDTDGMGECNITKEPRASNASICLCRQRELEKQSLESVQSVVE